MGHIARVREYWADTAPSVKRVTYVFVPAGVVVGGAGLYGDAHGWWDERGFLANLLSSATSLLFGVPTALIILGQLGAHQAEALERRAVRRRARLAVDALRGTFLRLFAINDLELLGETLRRSSTVIDHWNEALKALGDDEQSKRALREATAARDSLLATCLKVRRPLDIGEWLDELHLRWRQLDDEIRPQVEGAGLRWMPPSHYMMARRAIDRIAQDWKGVGPFTGVVRDVRVLLGEEQRRGARGPEERRQRLEQQGENDQAMVIGLWMLLDELPEIEKIAT